MSDWRLLLPGGGAEPRTRLRGDRTPLADAADAAAAVAPGGTLYAEVEDPERAVQELRAAGLTVTGTYAVWPDFANPRAYIPLGPPRALRWFAANLYPAWTLRKRLLRASLSFSGGSPDRGAGRLTRCFAVIAERAVRGDSGRPAAVFDHPALPAALRRASPLLVIHGQERAVVLPFLPGAAAPCAAFKVPREPGFNGKNLAEQEALTAVRARIDPALRAALPAPGGLLGWDGVAVGIESAVSGRPFVIPGTPWRRPTRRQLTDLRLAASWLTELHRQTELKRAAWDDGDIAAVARLFEQVGTPGADRLFGAALRRAESLRGVPLPRVWQHRDFTPWNLLRAPGRTQDIRVLDWEGARPGLPVCDLVHFLTHWHELTRRAFDEGTRRRAFEELWTGRYGSGPAVGAALDAAARYLTRLKIDLKFLPLLLTVTWAELAARPGGSGRIYLEALAARGERLFGEGR
jgi:hypothetical protein